VAPGFEKIPEPKKRQKERFKMRWEYKFVTIDLTDTNNKDDLQEAEDKVNALGEEGWEAVALWEPEGLSPNCILFKREKMK
jgi:uncharacterized protein DUF4177